MNLVCISDRVISLVDRGNAIDEICIEFSKAFDKKPSRREPSGADAATVRPRVKETSMEPP